ncbi:hypothetical protein [Pseudonocardia sp. HH130629-09]|uniref:hypothetical protein n=1 Tax=Pseudonocardia sp. HH130629-09 TaxID=1641402 RepID=UPI0006CAFABC|nr:hypothetical protein [Pseudonocardia sp. HH130629-09]ALE82477.1 hypothetical protein XF36_04400 [Pseudonocardia sp. HH130629-09]
MEWRVGVLRPGVENVDWTAGGDAPSGTTARTQAIDALTALVELEGIRQEYRMHVGDVPVMVWPGMHPDGRLDVSGLDAAVPDDRDAPAGW